MFSSLSLIRRCRKAYINTKDLLKRSFVAYNPIFTFVRVKASKLGPISFVSLFLK